MEKRHDTVEQLNTLSAKYIETSTLSLSYRELAEDIQHFCGALFAIINTYDPQKGVTKTEAIAGSQKLIGKAGELLGKPLLGTEYPIDKHAETMLSSLHLTNFGTLSKLAENHFTRSAVETIEKMFNLGLVWAMGLRRGTSIIGDVVLVFPGNYSPDDPSRALMIELLIRQTASVLSRRKTEREREEKQKILECMEKKLRDQLRFQRTLLETIPLPVFHKSALGHYTGCNAAFEQLTGLSRSELIGKTVFELWNPELAEIYDRADRELMLSREFQIYDARIKPYRTGPDGDGEERLGTFYKASCYDEKGDLLGIVGAVLDITERKARETLIRKNLEEKEILLREIHHRVKNNLQVISSLLNLQMLSIQDETAREYLLNSQNRVISMALVHDFLYHSEDLAAVDMESYIQALTEQIQETHTRGDKQIWIDQSISDITLDIDRAIPCGILLNELITNSYKYAFKNRKEGAITIRLEKANGLYTLSVGDDGPGIPKDAMEQSRGLGMQLIQALTKQLDGELSVNTEGGTTFSITFR